MPTGAGGCAEWGNASPSVRGSTAPPRGSGGRCGVGEWGAEIFFFFYWGGGEGPCTGLAVGGDGKCRKEEMRVRRGVVLVKRGLKEGEKVGSNT